MDLEVFKTEIKELIKKAETRKAAEKLLEVCKEGTYNYWTVEECLKRIRKLDEERKTPIYFSYSDYSVNYAKIDLALISILFDLSPEELESN